MAKLSKTKIAVVLAVSAIIVCLVIALAVALSVKTGGGSNTGTPLSNNFHPSSYSRYSSYAVSSDFEVCSNIGKSVFEKNGSAVDVAIATMFCIGVMSLDSSGIGGGHLAIIYDTPRNGTKKILTTLVAREKAPMNSTISMFQNVSSQIGGLSVGIPGEIKGFYSAWERFGRLPWSDLIEPSIQLLENGFKVGRSLARAMVDFRSQVENSPSLMSIYSKNNGTLLELGDIIKDPKLAKTLRNISANPTGFYDGPLAKEISREIINAGGIISEEDLRNYKVEWKDPTVVKLQGTNLTHYSLRPPSSGVVLGLILNIMAGYKLQSKNFKEENLILTYHRLVEAFKFSYAGRSKLGDENFVNVSQLVDEMSSSEFAEYIRSKIDDSKTFDDVAHYGGIYNEFDDHGTSHLNVYGPDGSAVAMTSTINIGFGSTVKGSNTGILYNDQMDDFSSPSFSNFYGYAPSTTNYIQPGKIPMSSMSPTFIMDPLGNIKLISGASGGSKIITAIADVSTNGMWADETLDRSVDRARVHHQLLPNVLVYDDWLDQMYVDGLKSKGHTLQASPLTATCNSIKISCNGEKCIEAVADGKKGGAPAGL